MVHRDPYRILGVAPDATADEIRAAFRVAARREHPDTAAGPHDGTSVRDVIDAYRLLMDPATRAQYDARHRDHTVRHVQVRRNSEPHRHETERGRPCATCGGTGAVRTTVACPACRGRAEVTVLDGRRSGVVRCRTCVGTGRVDHIGNCGSCRGSGLGPSAWN